MRKSGSVGGASQAVRVQSIGSVPGTAASSRFSLYGSASKRSVTPSSLAPSAKQSRPSGRPLSVSDVSKDPRPVFKAFKEQCMHDLLDFLIANNYSHPLTWKQLKQPSSSDFKKIFEFMIGFLKPGFKLSQKLEEEVPHLLKLYQYPFSIPKSHFQTIGVPHTWPTILYALNWIRINIEGSIQTEFQTVLLPRMEDDLGKVGQKKMLFDYVKETYDAFMMGEDEFGHMVADLEKKLSTDCQIESEIEALAKDRDRNLLMVTELSAETGKVEELRKNLGLITVEVEKFESYRSQVEPFLKQLKASYQLKLAEEKQEISQLQDIEREKNRKLQIVQSQAQSGIDFTRLVNKRNMLKKQIANREEEIKDRDPVIQKFEEEKAQDEEEIETMVKEMNRFAMELARECDDMGIPLAVPETMMTDSENLQIGFQSRELRVKLNKVVEKLEEELMKEKNQKETWEEIMREHQRTKDSDASALEQMSNQMTQQKEDLEKKMQDLQNQLLIRKSRLVNRMPDVAESKKRLQEERLALAELKDATQLEEEKACDFLHETIQMMMEHKRCIQAEVQQIHEEVKKWCD